MTTENFEDNPVRWECSKCGYKFRENDIRSCPFCVYNQFKVVK